MEPRVVVSNNDGSIRFYDVPMRVQSSRRKLEEVGAMTLDVPVNHCDYFFLYSKHWLIYFVIASISPDARTLLSVGDSNKVYFHRISGGSHLSFTPITTLVIPAPDANPFGFSRSSLVASFSSAFSRDGSKFAVGSQEGVVAVWDVRSTKPIKVFHSDKSRGFGRDRSVRGNGAASGWLSDDPWEWTRGTKAPGWCMRSVKFNAGNAARLGKEVLAFTEHTSVVHIVDALTFETHEIIRMPTIVRPPRRRHLRQSSAPSIIVSSADAQSSSRGTQIQRWPRGDTRVSSGRNTRRTSLASTPEPILRRPPVGGPSTDESGPSTSPSTTSSNQPGIIQALGDAFRIPASAYSAPSSIGDSTWRTLDDEMHLGPLSRRREVGSSTGISARSTPVMSTSSMPSLHALANYVLDEPTSNVREFRDDLPEEMDDEGILHRRIRRQESALRRGLEFGTLFEDEEENGGSGSDTTEYAPAGSTARNGTSPGQGRQGRGDDGFVVVPDLGDRDVESEVHAVLAVHGIQSRLGRRRSFDEDAETRDNEVDLDEDYGTETDRDTNTGSTHADYDYPLYRRRERRRRGAGRFIIPSAQETVFDEAEEDAAVQNNRMDVDFIHEDGNGELEEEDTDCISNSNSRSASPTMGSAGASPWNDVDHKVDDESDRGGFDDPRSGAYYSGSTPSSSPLKLPNLKYHDDIDIAGLCFDPWGERLYVAGTGTGLDIGSREGLFSEAFGNPVRNVGGRDLGTVIEWSVRGAEKRFWVDEGWM